MITIITGVPGAGKTLYAIEKLLLPLVGATIKVPDENGGEREVPRTIYTNINHLLLEHELVETGGEWVATGNDWAYRGNEQSARNWHQWAKPGAVIVVDEFQRMWPPRPNGSKTPPDVQALDTHRHMGVDFILITQSVMNTDRHVHALGGRHLHVRRLANLKAAIVYEWDHVSRSLQYSKALTKAPWRYSRRVFKMYRSAEAHTKQPRKLPGLVWFVLAGLAAAAYLGPTTYQRLHDRISGKPAEVAAKPATPAVSPAALLASAPASVPGTQVAAAPAAPAVSAPAAPVFAGCVASKVRCACYDTAGKLVEREPFECRANTSPPVVVLAGGTFPEPAALPPPPPPPMLSLVPQETRHGLEDLRRAIRLEYGS
jgi:zona occludens toxin